MPDPVEKKDLDLLKVDRMLAWKSRGLTSKSCRKWGVGVSEYKGQQVRVFPYRDTSGSLVAQKVRPADKKNMRFLNGDNKLLFGRHLWGSGGKMIVITEGEIDAVSISQVQDHKWPVVSVSSGASGAKKCLQANLEWLSTFETVVLWFDDDSPGREAVQACAPLFKPGKIKVASLPPFKDANEALLQATPKEIISAIWQAKPWRPDGIVAASDLIDSLCTEDPVQSRPLPWSGVNEKTLGARPGELVTLCAGSGIGKSAVIREIAAHHASSGDSVGMLMLEETTKRTALGLVGIRMDTNLLTHPDPSSLEGFEENCRKALGNVFLYDHFGSTSVENILDRIRYMAVALECPVIFLDHLSILVSGMADGDERRLIDNAMTSLATLAQETGVILYVVSHLRRPEKKGHEEGATTSLSQLRGSHAIAQLSHTVIGLERDQQGEDPHLTTLRILKCRWTGQTGIATYLRYNHDTGRLSEVAEPGAFDEAF